MLYSKSIPIRWASSTSGHSELRRLQVVLDMDECLIHSVFQNESIGQHRQEETRKKALGTTESFNIQLDNEIINVNKRPGVDHFLQECAKHFDVHIFTAATSEYANLVLDKLDPNNSIFKRRLYREHCTFRGGVYAKDLGHFVDKKTRKHKKIKMTKKNNKIKKCTLSLTLTLTRNFVPNSFFLLQLIFFKFNGIPIDSFYDDANDDCLSSALEVFHYINDMKDVRVWLNKTYKLRIAFQQHFRSKL
eukprot:GSMAST32.ASY1.ANO1.1256.1 assembled CDS